MPKDSIVYKGFTFDVTYQYWSGMPATYDQPAEPPEYDIYKITLDGIDASDLLDSQIDEFEEIAQEQLKQK